MYNCLSDFDDKRSGTNLSILNKNEISLWKEIPELYSRDNKLKLNFIKISDSLHEHDLREAAFAIVDYSPLE